MNTIYRFEADFTDFKPIGLVPEGFRVDAHYKGRIVQGVLPGGTVDGIDYQLFRSDGVGVLDVRELVEGASGERVSIRASGYLVLPHGMQLPPPQVMLRPDFRWPDVEVPLHGVGLAQTGVDDLAWLNRTALTFEGYANPGRAKLVITASAGVPISAATLVAAT